MKKTFAFLILVLLIANVSQGQILEERQKLYRIHVQDFKQIRNIESEGISIYNLNPEGFIEVLALPEQIDNLRIDGARIEFIANSFKEIWDKLPDFKAGPEYHDYQETMDEMTAIAAAYPEITQLTSIGESVAGRNIACIKISDNVEEDEDEPPILIVGCHHGNEVLSVEATLYQLNYLVQNYGIDPEVTAWVNSMEIWFVPLVNPDGREAVRRTNDHGVDLNRNYNFEFEAVGNHGDEAFSEPETSALRDFAAQFPPIMSLTYHTSGRYVLYSWTHTDDGAPDSTAMIYLGEKVAESIIYPTGGTTDDYLLRQGGRWYFTAGEYCDYMYAMHNTLAFTVEMYSSQTPDGSVIQEVVERNLEGFKTLLRQAGKAGVTGIVTDAATGNPLVARINIPAIDDQGKLQPRLSDEAYGRYYRYLEPGDYRFSVSVEGYRTRLIDVTITEDELTQLDIAMQPGPLLAFDEAILIDGTTGSVSGNGNGQVNLSETLGVVISLTNTNAIGATGAWVKISSESEYVNLLTDSLFFGNIDANSTITSGDTLLFEIVPDCKDATMLDFILEISDSDGLGWYSTFYQEVYAPGLEISEIRVDDVNGNQNGVLEKGERANITLMVINNGRQGISNVETTLSSDDQLFTIHDADFDLDDMTPGVTSGLSYNVELSQDVPDAHIGSFILTIVSSEGYAPGIEFRMNNILGYFDDFENGENGWTHASYGTTSNNHDDWQLGTPAGKAADPRAAYSGSNCWGTDMGWNSYQGESWNGEYQSSVYNYLRSPMIDCSQLTGVGLIFHKWLNTRSNDIGTVKVNGEVVWESSRRGNYDWRWSEEKVDISTIADQNSEVVVVFELRSNNSANIGGWNIDDVIVANGIFQSSSIDDETMIPDNIMENIFPNPFTQQTNINYSIAKAGFVEVMVFDQFGRKVRTLLSHDQSPGSYHVTWSGDSDSGETLANGVYYVYLKTNTNTQVRKLLFTFL
ncbi:MAG: T9SS type A sorting domain-containing protein [Bacteroidales bacterium]|nr:T9SS type A sorting domain-containing protein [Bacteroidales bacterium]